MQATAQPTIDLARELAQVRARYCVTVYGPLEHWMGEDRTDQPNAVTVAVEHQLRTAGAPDTEVSAILGRLRELREGIGSIDLRALPSIGIFATADGARVQPLTTAPTPVALVSDRFLVGPLVAAALSAIPPVFVLALSANAVRLVDATAIPARSVPVAELPDNLEEATRLDLTGDRQTLAHLRTSEDPKTRLREYSRAIASAVEPVLQARQPLLVLAAAEPIASIFRAVMHYQPTADDGIPGNHDDDTEAQLAALATPIADRERRIRIDRQLERFAEMPSRGRALVELRDVVVACRTGAVDTLLVDVDQRVPIPSQAFSMATTLDLVDEAIRAALDTDATIVPVRSTDLPSTDPVAAILRYPMTVQQEAHAAKG